MMNTMKIFMLISLFVNSTLGLNYFNTVLSGGSTQVSNERTEYFDGQTRIVQRAIKTGPGDNDVLVQGYLFDMIGRIEVTTKPFPDSSAPFDDFIALAGNYFLQTLGDDSAYARIEYYKDPLQRPRAEGAYGKEYTITAGNETRRWFFGIRPPAQATSVLDKYGFVLASELTNLDNLSVSVDNATHFLEITRDPDGRYTQILKDGFGRVVRQWSNNARPARGSTTIGLPTDADRIISEFKYDILDSVLIELPPQPDAAAPCAETSPYCTKYEYTTRGLRIKKTAPDNGSTEYRHDAGGKVRYILEQKNKDLYSGKRFLVYVYDQWERLIEIREARLSPETSYLFSTVPVETVWDASNSVLLVRHYFDRLPSDVALKYSAELGLPVNELTYEMGHLVGSIAFAQNGSETARDFYAYNETGVLSSHWKSLPGLAMQKRVYEYDLQNRINTFAYWDGSSNPVTYFFKYDVRGQLEGIYRDPNMTNAIVRYAYKEYGPLLSKTFYDPTGTARKTITYSYNMRDWETVLDAPNVFREELTYTPWFNGNIGAAAYQYTFPGATKNVSVSYTYDHSDRISDADVANVTADPSFLTRFQESYAYDHAGRISSKVEGGTSVAGMPLYTYAADKNQLSYLDGHLSKGYKGAGANYIYDPNGNLVYDFSRNLSISYDWRNLPTAFTYWNHNPSGTTWNSLDFRNCEAAYVTTMAYDAGGHRTNKDYRSAQRKVIPLLDGVFKIVQSGVTRYFASYGYRNPNEFAIELSDLSDNGFMVNNALQGRGQPTLFSPGEFHNIFITEFTASEDNLTWILDGTASDAAMVNQAVTTPVDGVSPIVERVLKNCDNTYTGIYGYKNPYTTPVLIPVGSTNRFAGSTQNLGQPILFQPGRHRDVFSVVFDGTPLVWVLSPRTSTAGMGMLYTATVKPVLPILEQVNDNNNGTYTAIFGYRNDNDFAVEVPFNCSNVLTGTTVKPPTFFRQGWVSGAVAVTWNGTGAINWRLGSKLVTAGKTAAQQWGTKARTAYIDDAAVFEMEQGSKIVRRKYTTITAPTMGTEGRIEATGSLYYNIKDHQGSTRAVISAPTSGAKVTAAMMYHSYGSLVSLMAPNPGTREEFTGKELDEDGPVYNAVALSITVTDFIIKTDAPAPTMTLTFSDGTEEVLPLNYNNNDRKLSLFRTLPYPYTVNVTGVRITATSLFAGSSFDNVNNTVRYLDNGKLLTIAIGPVAASTLAGYGGVLPESMFSIGDYVDNDRQIVRGPELYYFGKRYYDPEIGRWISVDPVPQFWDMYNFCGGNPVNRTDPDGGIAPLIVAGIVISYEAAATLATLEAAEITRDIVTAPDPVSGIIGAVIPIVPSQAVAPVKNAVADIGGKAWKAIIEGAAHGSIPHRIRTYREAITAAKSGEYVKVFINKAISTITGGKVKSRIRPDVGKVTKGEPKVDVTEVVSPKSQTVGELEKKVEKIENILGEQAGNKSNVTEITTSEQP